jgi:hypothetical protein
MEVGPSLLLDQGYLGLEEDVMGHPQYALLHMKKSPATDAIVTLPP